MNDIIMRSFRVEVYKGLQVGCPVQSANILMLRANSKLLAFECDSLNKLST